MRFWHPFKKWGHYFVPSFFSILPIIEHTSSTIRLHSKKKKFYAHAGGETLRILRYLSWHNFFFFFREKFLLGKRCHFHCSWKMVALSLTVLTLVLSSVIAYFGGEKKVSVPFCRSFIFKIKAFNFFRRRRGPALDSNFSARKRLLCTHTWDMRRAKLEFLFTSHLIWQSLRSSSFIWSRRGPAAAF